MSLAMRQPDVEPEPPTSGPPPFDVAFEDGRQVVTIRPRGVGRFGGAAFLAFWLCGWALGETFATAALLGTLLATFAPGVLDALGLAGRLPGLGGGGLFIMLFLAVWLTFWTIGGLAAMRELLRLVASSDRIAVGAGAIELDQRLGPFRSRHTLAAGEIRRIELTARGVVTAVLADGKVVLTALGTAEERKALAAWLRGVLPLSRAVSAVAIDRQRQRDELPAGWESEPAANGEGVLLRRDRRTLGRQAAVLYALAAIAALAFVLTVVPALRGDVPRSRLFAGMPALLIGAGFALGGVYVQAGGRVLAAFPGRLEVRRFVLDRWRVRELPVSFLSLERGRDSDGDLQHRLIAHGAKSMTLQSALDDPGELLHLGRWLAARLGVRFDAPKDLVDE